MIIWIQSHLSKIGVLYLQTLHSFPTQTGNVVFVYILNVSREHLLAFFKDAILLYIGRTYVKILTWKKSHMDVFYKYLDFVIENGLDEPSPVSQNVKLCPLSEHEYWQFTMFYKPEKYSKTQEINSIAWKHPLSTHLLHDPFSIFNILTEKA